MLNTSQCRFMVQFCYQVSVGEGGTTAWKTCSLTPQSTVTVYLDVATPHAVRTVIKSSSCILMSCIPKPCNPSNTLLLMIPGHELTSNDSCLVEACFCS